MSAHYAVASNAAGRRYEFMIKSWANGTEHRRVFVLEQAAEFLRSHGIGVGDAVGICTDESGEPCELADVVLRTSTRRWFGGPLR